MSAPPKNTSPLHVLVVDDDPVACKLLEVILKECGHSSESVFDGASAIATVRDRTFDLVLMDVRMPETDGVEATEAIRGFTGPDGTIPVIAVTAEPKAISDVREDGSCFNGYVAKPVYPDALAAAIEVTLWEMGRAA